MVRVKLRRQPLVKGGRTPMSAGFIRELEQAIALEQKRFRCSRSFVIATAVGYALNVGEQADYHVLSDVKSTKKRKLTAA